MNSTEIEKLRHTVTNIWNVKQFRTMLPLPMFFVELKADPNNKDIFNVEHLHQYKSTLEPLKHKRDITQCANVRDMGTPIIFATSNQDA
jgi:hypothetical protein